MNFASIIVTNHVIETEVIVYSKINMEKMNGVKYVLCLHVLVHVAH